MQKHSPKGESLHTFFMLAQPSTSVKPNPTEQATSWVWTFWEHKRVTNNLLESEAKWERELEFPSIIVQKFKQIQTRKKEVRKPRRHTKWASLALKFLFHSGSYWNFMLLRLLRCIKAITVFNAVQTIELWSRKHEGTLQLTWVQVFPCKMVITYGPCHLFFYLFF